MSISGVSIEVSQVEHHSLQGIALVSDLKGNFFQLNWINLITAWMFRGTRSYLPALVLHLLFGSIFSVHFYK